MQIFFCSGRPIQVTIRLHPATADNVDIQYVTVTLVIALPQMVRAEKSQHMHLFILLLFRHAKPQNASVEDQNASERHIFYSEYIFFRQIF